MLLRDYRQEISQAWKRVRDVSSRNLETTWGSVEPSVAGRGQPVLMSHGIMGGHPAGLGMVSAYYGDAFAIAPSRFGYFGSELPVGATPAMQADVYAELLDALDIDRAVVIGLSAGGPSAIEFALARGISGRGSADEASTRRSTRSECRKSGS